MSRSLRLHWSYKISRVCEILVLKVTVAIVKVFHATLLMSTLLGVTVSGLLHFVHNAKIGVGEVQLLKHIR